MPKELSHVYVIEDEHHSVKIGISGNVAKRIKSLETASAYNIINRYESPLCLNASKIEKAAHKFFADRHKKGEWFDIPFNEAVNFVKSHFIDSTEQLTFLNNPAPKRTRDQSEQPDFLSSEIRLYIQAHLKDEVKNILAKPKPIITNNKSNFSSLKTDELNIAVKTYLADKQSVTIAIIADDLQLKANKLTRNQIANALRQEGWQSTTRLQVGGKRKRGWKQPES